MDVSIFGDGQKDFLKTTPFLEMPNLFHYRACIAKFVSILS